MGEGRILPPLDARIDLKTILERLKNMVKLEYRKLKSEVQYKYASR